jgi:ABC-type multidrug transport system ATPase subunit
MGPNGIGKSTLLKIVMGDLEADAGEIEWGYETHPGYFEQDNKDLFKDSKETTEEWLWGFCPGKDRGFVRGQMGLMLFSGDDGEKKVRALSGGEAARLVFSRLALDRPNVLVLDEPTNHLDLEAIEALVLELQRFEGTLIFVSHDRWFVSRLATRVVEIKPDEVRDYRGTYEEYVHFCGDDHLDSDTVILRARREKGKGKKEGKKEKSGATRQEPIVPLRLQRDVEKEVQKLDRRRDELTATIEAGEARIAEIDSAFCEEGYYERTSSDEVSALERERDLLRKDVERSVEEWSEVERTIDELSVKS